MWGATLNQIVSLSNLEYDIHTKNIVLKTADWLYHDSLKEFLRVNGRFDAHQVLDRAKTRLQTGMNRQVSDGVGLSATMDSLQGLGIFAAPDTLFVRVRLDGSATLTVR